MLPKGKKRVFSKWVRMERREHPWTTKKEAVTIVLDHKPSYRKYFPSYKRGRSL